MSDAPLLLIVEDEDPQRRLLAGILSRAGYRVEAHPSAEAALEAWSTADPALVLSDWRLPGMDGGALLAHLREEGYGGAFLVMTAYGSIAHAVEAIQLGADDYLSKPFEREAMLLAVRRVLKAQALKVENRALRQALTSQERYGALIGKAPSMQRLYRTVEKIASTDATVLISGESGTGKELVARTLHTRSGRSEAPFVALNCAAIPESLIESELFGHEKGAFTGAHRQREGRIAQAEGGTLFLDEIPSMPLNLQGTLLRVLQERRYTPLGAREERPCDVRIVAASNRDLKAMVDEGSFREDLYYRLNVVPIALPPLRQRRDDIPLLARALFDDAARRHDVQVAPPGGPVLERLRAYDWPGNVRELSNVMERLALLCDGDEIRVDDLPDEVRAPSPPQGGSFRLPAEGLVWDDMEADLLGQALERCEGNRSAAARLLGLSYKTFLYRLDKYGLTD